MSIEIKGKEMTIPVVQGGMGIGISTGELAGAVAAEGGMGTLSFVNCGYEEEDFYQNPIEANKRAFEKNLKKAKEISQGKGILMVNIMHVVNHFFEYLEFINTTEIDGVVVGAGLPLELPQYIGEDKRIAPIVSSGRALKIILRKWKKKYNRVPDFVVLESPKAGGHLGFKKEDLSMDLFQELEEIKKILREYGEESIPVFIGGGFGTKEGFQTAMEKGADGVQIGTGFLFTKESGLDPVAKECLVESLRKGKIEDQIIQSPVGLLGRALNTEFVRKVEEEKVPAKHCVACISTCNPKTTPYCINEALIRGVKGNQEEGLFFSGSDGRRIKEILSVKDYLKEILGE